ncbi:hypothetical protein B0H15DRAFT_956871 [Mycena belliarum]|uniref:Uncharacterized protein n=1 Tax=Mycena belliarum TaxID=1033014 RepID=A0AAD6TND7_9AGAR|nr:hypothetical protein B0H15DRAFT_956871 [Mycena belliae]
MANIVEVTLSNQLSDGLKANPDFEMKLCDGSPLLKAGTVAWRPRDVGSLKSKPSNAGIYQSSARVRAIEGIVSYMLPGTSKSMLVIYFSNSKCRLLLIADNTTITEDLIDQVEDEDRKTAEGNPAYDVKVSAGSPVLTSGAVGAPPIDVPSQTREGNNGGIYQSLGGRGSVRGATGYNLPGGTDVLVVYFDNNRGLVSTVPAGSSLTTAEVEAAAGGSRTLTGTFTVAGERASYTASVEGHPSGDALAVTVMLRNSML